MRGGARWSRANGRREGYFKATHIMAKHSEEYKAPHDTKEAQSKRLLDTLDKAER